MGLKISQMPIKATLDADDYYAGEGGTGSNKKNYRYPASAVSGGGFIGAWSTFETISIPSTVTMVQTADTLAAGSATGTSSAMYKVDTEQTEFTAQMQAFIDASVADGTVMATAQAAMRLHQKFWRRLSLDGRWFTLAEPIPHMGMFGCPGDGGQDFNNAMSGTDVFNGTTVLNLQAFYDYCLYFAKCEGRYSVGTHRHSKGIQLGYPRGFGPGYVGGKFVGAGQAFFGSSAFVGTTFVCDSDSEIMLNLSSYRNVYIAHASFRGKYAKWLLDKTLPYNASAPVLDNLDPVSWIDQTLRQTQNGRFNPYAGVTLGAYDGDAQAPTAWATSTIVQFSDAKFVSTRLYECVLSGTTSGAGTGPAGTDPTVSIVDGTAKWRYVGVYNPGAATALTAYPEPYKPAWLMNPAKTAFGNIYYGSKVVFDNVTFNAFHVGLCSKPCANSAQSDFTTTPSCNFVENRYSVSIGNDQSRNFSMRDANSALCDCTVTNFVHGNRLGLLNPAAFDNLSSGASVDIFRVTAAYGGGMTFNGLYTESQRRLGQVLGGGSLNNGPTFNDPNLNFPFVVPERGIAPRLLYGEAQGSAGVGETTFNGNDRGARFNGGTIGVENVFSAFIEGTTFNGTVVYAFNRAANVDVSQAAFHNHTAGGVIFTGLVYTFSAQKVIFRQKNLDSGASIASQVNTDRGFHASDRTVGVPAMVKSAWALNNDRAEEIIIPHKSTMKLTVGSGGVTAAVSGGDATEMNLTYPSATLADADLKGYGSGAAALHGPTGMTGYVRSYNDTTKVITIVAQDNIKTVSAVKSYLFPVSTTSGEWAFSREGFYLPATPAFGDLAPTVTATTNSSDTLTSVSGTLAPGQKLATVGGIPANTTVLSVSGTTAKMTAAASASTAGVTVVDGATIANVGASNGVGTTLTTDIAVGDYLASPPLSNALALETSKVSTRTNGSPGSIVLTSAALKTRVGERLIFQRPSPANT